MASVHSCPKCELKFLTEAELAEHLRVDHHTDPETFERFHYKPLEARPPGRRVLILANQTLDDSRLLERATELGRGGAHFHVVAPVAPSPGSDHVDENNIALATYRLRKLVDALHALGFDAEGEFGDTDPVRAVARALEHEPADEIIVSTQPAGISRWLAVDVPTALQRRFGLPVTVLTQAS
jgi:hypothetical protein